MSDLTLGSLFDGSGGFPLGGLIAGITPVWASEIEPFPIRVTTKRLPFMKHYGDISQMDGKDIESVDIISFGSPCQDMSVAGKRSGLDGSRSSLFYQAIRIVKEMREKTNGKYPRYIVWENVPGAFSSNKGEDFRAVLEQICQIKNPEITIPFTGRWESAGSIVGNDFSLAWRVLDAQHWGVPQRRKRIYLVADFAGRSAGKILFESESMPGYTPQSFKSWQTATGCPAEGTDETSTVGLNSDAVAIENHPTDGRVRIEEDGKVQTLTSRMGTGGNNVPLLFENHSQDTRYRGPLKVAQTVSSTYGTGGNNQPFVVQTPKTLKIRCGCEGGGKGALLQENKSATLSCNNDQTLFQPTRSIDCRNLKVNEEKSGTLQAKNNGGHSLNYINPVAYSSSKASYFTTAERELANTLVATDYKDPPIVNDSPSYGFYPQMKAECVMLSEEKSGCLVNGTNPGYQNGVLEGEYIVRRLTPTECARLQGFPDWWCDNLEIEEPTHEDVLEWEKIFETHAKAIGENIKVKSKEQIRKWLQNPYSDSAEYKMWGNGVALPNVVYVLSAIANSATEKV